MTATDPKSILADACRRPAEPGDIGIDELEECAQILANAEGHGSAIRVLIRALGPRPEGDEHRPAVEP
jgi:hypothetical protein